MSFPFPEIEEKIGYAFRDRGLLKQAFTHSTYANLYGGEDNERMEYLGDSVLELVVTEWQYEKDKRPEGKLTEARQRLVRKEALDSVVDGLGIFEYLLYSGRKQNLGDKTKSSLFEALTAAIYLDGGYFAAKKFVLSHGNLYPHERIKNYKGELQEFLQARGHTPVYAKARREGPDHAPVFYSSVSAMGESADGEGKNIKEAESIAASRLLWELKSKYGEKPAKHRKK